MGRPAKTPSADDVAQVAIWRKAKVSIEEMARRLGMTPKTFRKHFVDPTPVETVITPRFTPTAEQREMALILAGCHWPHEWIATELGIEVQVLEEHFASELRDGPVKYTAPVLRTLWYAAKAGNVAASKVCLVLGAQPEQSEQQPAAIGLKGKKETQRITAQTAERGTVWEDIISGKPN